MFYLVKTPWLLKMIYHECTWQMAAGEKKIYLSFDDGPHPEATNFVLDELAKFNAKATFFCIGKNVEEQPLIYKRLLDAGHSTGNHTYNHLNGWKTNDEEYLGNIKKAGDLIHSNLFRPPYGRIRKRQAKKLLAGSDDMQIIMWTVLSGDFDPGISNEKCLNHVLKNSGDGSIIVFHDSEKAFMKLRYALPKVLKHFSESGFTFDKI